jgi:hypothetical protein
LLAILASATAPGKLVETSERLADPELSQGAAVDRDH